MTRRNAPPSPVVGALAAALAAALACSSASAHEPFAPASVSPLSNPAVPLHLAIAALPAPAVSGMVAHLDPETGEIGGMPAPGTPGFDLSTVGGLTVDDLVEELAWDGSVMVNLRGLFQEFAVLRFDAHGRPFLNCGPDAGTLLATPLPAAPVVAEE